MRMICAITIAVFVVSVAKVGAQEGKITVRVLDESGVPITNAVVHAGFATAIKPGWGWGAGKPNRVEGFTDSNGVCSLQGSGNGGSVGIAAFKDSFYGSSGYQVLFTNLIGTVERKWQPWNPVIQVVLKPVGNRIPMYAKNIVEASVPVRSTPIGFDLIAGDWVTPHGKGQEEDFLVTFSAKPERVYTNWYGSTPRIHSLLDYTLTISFPKEDAGVVPVPVPLQGGGSGLRLSREAPGSGYVSVIQKRVYQEESKPPHTDICKDQNYFFRVRTKKDDKGNIINALYGKIHGDFQFDHLGKLTFTYYLNPTPNDRNLEFDSKQNLFKNLSSLEEVRDP
ncbi:MAG: hypothetical protein KKG09_04475 [Verrucomicrobia bacterium]|nr:hypothetical protein [Verrucomicrobiota bacterium]MCG2680490.1 hypothetical protein [Kiritimatiellia bacterium]MBU4247768.1 hypothetical protein [Verrucomicrobiota bacterium]MBU4289575.1 hypothetical protein [Verrucomicrobiota bacterium]MBU4428745.1 hypothetical protein [Verrucomicrobiota bacterium]